MKAFATGSHDGIKKRKLFYLLLEQVPKNNLNIEHWENPDIKRETNITIYMVAVYGERNHQIGSFDQMTNKFHTSTRL